MTIPRLGSGRARRTDPVTSHTAGDSIEDSLAELQTVVLHALRQRGAMGGTSFEVALDTQIDRVTISPRFKPLEQLGLVVRSLERRPGPSGRQGIVWYAAEHAPQQAIPE